MKKEDTKVTKEKKIKPWNSETADEKFSKWIRARDGKCVNCGKDYNLTCSHYWSRKHSSTRYDPENCITLCWMPCHITWEKEKQGDYMTLMLRRIGKEKYDELEKRHRQIMKRDEAIRRVRLLIE